MELFQQNKVTVLGEEDQMGSQLRHLLAVGPGRVGEAVLGLLVGKTALPAGLLCSKKKGKDVQAAVCCSLLQSPASSSRLWTQHLHVSIV